MTRVLLFLFSLILSTELFSVSAEKIALIIAVGDYPQESGWRKINSSNDVSIIRQTLINQGFAEKDIAVLKEMQATRQGILQAIEKLYNRTKKGSIVYFHFSGHGQQIVDDNGDEVDGLDEAIVPFDAGMRYEFCQAKGANHIRDDLIGVLIDKIRKKIGPEGDMIVVFDACHSGTATRGIGVSRGTDLIFGPPGHLPVPTGNIRLKQGYYEPTGAAYLSPIVIFSGSSATEQNYEYTFDNVSYGSLSFAMSRVMNQMKPDMTYRAVFSKVQNLMSSMVPRQNPQLEGSADRILFAGRAVEQGNFTTVKLWRNAESVLLDAGQLNGFNNNTVVEFYPVGTKDTHKSNALSSGTVVNAQLNEALVVLDKPLSREPAMNSWVFIKELSFGKTVIPVKITKSIPRSFQEVFISKIKDSRFISIVENEPELLFLSDPVDSKRVMVITRNDHVIFRGDLAAALPGDLAEAILRQIELYAQAQLLRSVESVNERLRVTFELIPVKLDNNYKEVGRIPIESKINRSGQLVFNSGDFFRIRITNHGNRTAYYSLIDIQPDNVVSILIPEKDQNGNLFRAPSDCKIGAGQTEELRTVFYIKEPYGQEVFKLIATNRPLHLDQILVTRAPVSDSESVHPFEALFAGSFDLVTRDAGQHRLPPEQIHIHTVVFEIRE